MFSGHRRARLNSSYNSRRSSKNSTESRLSWAAEQQGRTCIRRSENDALYFGSYAHVKIHEEMIKVNILAQLFIADF
ncbi:hypothetical protein SUGI_1186190 [Cryptomeria japonica]|nr:hypothetical protein SUGI_1186190 [Cryptomeria japonica]